MVAQLRVRFRSPGRCRDLDVEQAQHAKSFVPAGVYLPECPHRESQEKRDACVVVALHYTSSTLRRFYQPLRLTSAMAADVSNMSGPSKNSPPYSGTPENPLTRVEQLRQEAAAFQRTVEEELRRVKALIEEVQVSQAKRRGRGRHRE